MNADRSPSKDKTKRLLEETKKRGLLIGMGGFYGNVIRLAPPLSVTAEECRRALAIIEESLAAI